MQNLGVNEAANAIRGTFFSDRSFRGHPDEAHQIKFAKDVVKVLGADDTPENVIHVMALLREAGIDLPVGQEFPKYAVRDWDKTSKIVNDEQEEKEWVEEAKPDPEAAAQASLREQVQPVQDLSLDLVNQVPQHVDHSNDHFEGRVPSAVTNREAAQDAHARQSVETLNRDEAAAGYDPGLLGKAHADAIEGQHNVDDDHSHEVHEVNGDDDGEVHVEDLAPTGSKAEGGAPYVKPADIGVMAHDDPDGDGIAGQDVNPTHDSVLGTGTPQMQSDDSSAGKVEEPVRRPVGNRRPR